MMLLAVEDTVLHTDRRTNSSFERMPRRRQTSSSSHHGVVFVGDSDIARWPPHLMPFCRDERTSDDDPLARNDRTRRCAERPQTVPHNHEDQDRQHVQPPGRDLDRFAILEVSGRDGAVMRDVMEVVRDSIHEWMQAMDDDDDDDDHDDDYDGTDTSDAAVDQGQLFVVVCAGENDIGSGTSTHETVEHWSSLLEAVEDEDTSSRSPPSRRLPVSIVLLGPTLEPWLADDPDSRKCYVRLSRALEARCRRHRDPTAVPSKGGVQAHFVDCLTMFCTPETVNAPGSLLGGRAMPDSSYFENDELHLSEAGYRVWKKTVEDALVVLTNSPAD